MVVIIAIILSVLTLVILILMLTSLILSMREDRIRLKYYKCINDLMQLNTKVWYNEYSLSGDYNKVISSRIGNIFILNYKEDGKEHFRMIDTDGELPSMSCTNVLPTNKTRLFILKMLNIVKDYHKQQ